MQDRRLNIQILTVAGYLAWFGGLFRLVGESAALALARLRGEGPVGPFVTSLGIALALGALVLIALAPRYVRFVLQTRRDLATSRGVDPGDLPSARASLQRQSRAIAAFVGGAMLLTVILPGLTAAIVSIMVGLVLRIAGLTLVAVQGSRSDTAR